MASFRKYKTKRNGTRWKYTVSFTTKDGQYKQVSKSGFPTKRSAAIEALEVENELRQNPALERSTLTFNQLYKKWFKTQVDLKESSKQNTRSVMNNHVLPIFGEMIVARITVDDCQAAVEKWYLHPYKKYNRFFLLLRSILEFAVDRHYLMSNPAAKVHLPRADRQPIKVKEKKAFYTLDELQNVLRSMRHHAPFKMFTFFWLLAHTGLRRGEIIGLQWRDIDFEQGTLTVNRTQTYGLNNQSITNSPKTKLSHRTIFLDHQTLAYLKKWLVEQGKLILESGEVINRTQTPVFNRQSDFKMMSATYPAQWLKRFCERYGVPYVEIKGWRHTYATLGIEQNHLTPKQVQAQLGHSTTNMTLNVYAGITDQEKARTADIMGKLIDLQR